MLLFWSLTVPPPWNCPNPELGSGRGEVRRNCKRGQGLVHKPERSNGDPRKKQRCLFLSTPHRSTILIFLKMEVKIGSLLLLLFFL